MANEYKRWFVRNDLHTWRRKTDAYKRPFTERYQRPSEYTPSVEEYRHYPAMNSIVSEQEDRNEEFKQDEASKRSDNAKRQSGTAKSAGRNAGNIVKNIVGKVVAVVGGGAIIISSYQTMAAKNAAPVVPIVEKVEADWAAWDMSDFTFTIKLKDADGNVIKEIPAKITLTEVPATCTEAGSKTYTATANDGVNEYSDSHTDTLAPTGHKFDGGKVKTDENGNSVIVYECSECHEKFEVSAGATEND